MAPTGYLADTSVLHRVGRNPDIAERVAALRNSGLLWTCDVVTLELGYSARNRDEWLAIESTQSHLRQAPTSSEVVGRAIEMQGLMVPPGTHRVKVADLLIAAAAERAGVTVLHYDGDFDRIAAATGQPTEWAAPAGTIS